MGEIGVTAPMRDPEMAFPAGKLGGLRLCLSLAPARGFRDGIVRISRDREARQG